jgi:beta-lactamase class A
MNSSKLLTIIKNADGVWGMLVKRIGQDAEFEYNAEVEFPAASIGKVPIALYIFHLIDHSEAHLGQIFEIKKKYYLGGTGILQFLKPNLKLPLEDIIKLMLIKSDNTAAKFLASTYGPRKINSYLQSLGFQKTQLGIHGKKFDFGTTTPKEITDLLEGIYNSSFLSKKSSTLLINIMKKCEHQLGIRRYLPPMNFAGQKLEVANKSGALDDVRHDVEIVFAKHPYIISVLSKDIQDTSYRPENAGVLTIARLSEEVYKQLK